VGKKTARILVGVSGSIAAVKATEVIRLLRDASHEVDCVMTEQQVRERHTFAISSNITTLRNRVNELGVAEAVVQRQGLDRILVQLPGVQDPGEAKRVLGSTATLEIHLVDSENDPAEAERRGRAPLGLELQKMKNGTPYLFRRDVIASFSGCYAVSLLWRPHRQKESPAMNKIITPTSVNRRRTVRTAYLLIALGTTPNSSWKILEK